MPHTHRLQPGESVNLAEYPTRGEEFLPQRDIAEAEFRSLREQLIAWQRRLYAEDKRKLLIVFQAMDAGGKDSAIRKVTRGVNPQGVRVASFKVPTPEELAHDFLWRVHKVTPANGMITIFNRSHYEDVLIVRVDELVPESVWRPRYEHINNFEKLLHDANTMILKFYLHISREEQRERFVARLENPEKNWKFSRGDLAKRAQWDEYMQAYDEMLERCTTPWAPWYIIPADQKWYRNLAVTRAIVGALEEMNPQFPPPEEDLSGIIIE